MSQKITNVQRSLSPLLGPLGSVYGQAMKLRQALYSMGVMASWKPPAFTVSVGNVGWGGTGKTPLVSWLLGWASGRGLRPVVLTRGYKAKPGKLPYLVASGAMAEEAGDEPLMLARQHPDASILVDPVRIRSGRYAQRELNSNLYLLDDGFQHLAVKRDVNLVLLTQEDMGEGWNKIIPAGSWREGVEGLSRAHAFLIKASGKRFLELAELARARLKRFGKPVFSFSILPTGLRRVTDAVRQPNFGHERYLLFTGVGRPRQAEATIVKYLGYGPEEHRIFPDHHFFTRADVAALEMAATERGCDHILCTPKDAVKLGSMASGRFWTMELDLSFGPSLGAGGPFNQWWDSRFDSLHLKRYGEIIGTGEEPEDWDDLTDLPDASDLDDTDGSDDPESGKE